MRGLLTRASLLAAALALSTTAPAFAQDTEKRLIKVTHPSEAAIHELESTHDVGYVGDHTEAAVYLTPAEEGVLRARGFTIGEVVEDKGTWEARKAEIAATDANEELAGEFAQDGVDTSKLRGAVPPPGQTVIMRAYTFTNYAGRFLYVEAHNKAHEPNVTGPAVQMSYAGPNGVYSIPVNGTRFSDEGKYLYHRYLVALTGASASVPTEDIDVRVAAATGSTDTAVPTKWASSTLPPRIAEFQKDFITKYMDPSEIYERIDKIAVDYPGIAEIVDMPHDTPGYQRQAMAVMAGTTAPGSNPSGGTAQGYAVQLFSKAMGHLGGNEITAQFVAPTTPDQALGVVVDGKNITVNLATNATGALSSTAAQVRDAINASEPASALVTAYLYGTNAGAGVVPARARVTLSDYLAAPARVQRGPFNQRLLRIGKQRDGTKTGVYIYCQQHAREWVTPITCLETAERLVKNYATDPTTKNYVDNLDIFILPSANPDGGHYSFHDSAGKRRNMANYCPPTSSQGAVGNRNSWGVDLNRNATVGSVFDGYDGAGMLNPNNPADFGACTGDTFAGPFEGSEPEMKNELWVADTFPKIKFAINIHTHGGYFMWAPGAYKPNTRETLPSPNIGEEKYFFEVSETILSHIANSRGTVLLPERTGPISEVLYSAAGNSADDQWYRKGIISYSFEAGAQRMTLNSETGAYTRSDVGFQPCFGGPGTQGPFNSATSCGTVGNPNALMVNEGHDSTMEFADGNYGLLEGAYQFANDVTAPDVAIEFSAAQTSGEPINYRFNWLNESAVIHYTTDGSTPTTNSPKYESQGTRRPGQVLTLAQPGAYTIKWIAKDMKGNISPVKSQRLLVAADDTDGPVGGNVPATLALSLGTPAAFPPFIPGVAREYTASTTATVISTAGEATLTVSDPGANPGFLVNGTFKLAQSLGGLGVVKTWSGPTSNEAVPVTFTQAIGANDPLRTGTYSKPLTFTLSTNTP